MFPKENIGSNIKQNKLGTTWLGSWVACIRLELVVVHIVAQLILKIDDFYSYFYNSIILL
jgi:hypothetical protein